jgi:hypothetical protein
MRRASRSLRAPFSVLAYVWRRTRDPETGAASFSLERLTFRCVRVSDADRGDSISVAIGQTFGAGTAVNAGVIRVFLRCNLNETRDKRGHWGIRALAGQPGIWLYQGRGLPKKRKIIGRACRKRHAGGRRYGWICLPSLRTSAMMVSARRPQASIWCATSSAAVGLVT